MKILKVLNDIYSKFTLDPIEEVDKAGKAAQAGLKYLPGMGEFIMEHPYITAILIVVIAFLLAQVYKVFQNIFRRF